MSDVIRICIKECVSIGNHFYIGDIINVEDGYGAYRNYKLIYSEDYEYYMGAVDPSIIEENFINEDIIIEIDKKFTEIIYG